MDVAKYLITAVLISSIFQGFDSKWTLYIVGSICVIFAFSVGMLMYDKNTNQ